MRFMWLVLMLSCGNPPPMQNYANIVITSDGQPVEAATAYKVASDQMLSCWHVFSDPNYPRPHIIRYDADLDLVLFSTKKDNGFVPFAWGVPTNGEEVFIISNSMGLDKVTTKHIISKVSDEAFLFYPPLAPGSSGAFIWDTKGHCVGMVRGFLHYEGSPAFGVAIPSPVLQKFLSEEKRK